MIAAMPDTDEDPFDCEALRPPEYACAPDPRTRNLVVLNPEAATSEPTTLEIQHARISRFLLTEKTPEHVRVSFETAKNLYLYSWFVFRFYPVAEQHALVTLEFALKERFADFVRDNYTAKGRSSPGLSALLRHGERSGVLSNSKFRSRGIWAAARARERNFSETVREMERLGVEKMIVDESVIAPSEEDLKYDWLEQFISSIPAIRNEYAHGSRTLRHSVLPTFEYVTELINQLFPDQSA